MGLDLLITFAFGFCYYCLRESLWMRAPCACFFRLDNLTSHAFTLFSTGERLVDRQASTFLSIFGMMVGTVGQGILPLLAVRIALFDRAKRGSV